MTIEDEAKRAAADFRRSFGLGNDPFGDLVALVEDAAAVDVAVLDVGPGIDGMLAYDPKRDVAVVGLAATDVPLRQRSTLAHELAHLIFQDWEVLEGAAACSVGTQTPTEIRADTFARHLLIPADGLREFLAARARPVDDAALSSIVRTYLVSPQVAAIALEAISAIDSPTKERMMRLTAPRLATRFGWSDQYASLQADSARPRAPQRLLAKAVEGYRLSVLPVAAIARLRGTEPAKTAAELKEAGITPVAPTPILMRPDEFPLVHVDPADLDQLDAELAESE